MSSQRRAPPVATSRRRTIIWRAAMAALALTIYNWNLGDSDYQLRSDDGSTQIFFDPVLRALALPASDMRERDMRTLITMYRQCMLVGNRRLISRCIHMIQLRRGLTEKQKLDIMAQIWFHELTWPCALPNELSGNTNHDNNAENNNNANHDEDSDKSLDQRRLEQNVTCLNDVENLSHIHMGGLYPRSLRSSDAVDLYVQAIEEVATENACSDMIDGTDRLTLDLAVPNELKLFFHWADGIQDPDFWNGRMCEWLLPGLEKYVQDLNDFQDHAMRALHCYSLDLDATVDSVSHHLLMHLDILAGFRTGDTTDYREPKWQSFYLFCRPRVHGNVWENVPNQGYAWRYVFNNSKISRRRPKNPPLVFDKMSQLLSFYARAISEPQNDFKVLKMICRLCNEME